MIKLYGNLIKLYGYLIKLYGYLIKLCGYLINSRYLIAEIRQGLIAHESSLGGADVSGLWATRDNLPLIVMIMMVMIMLMMIMIVMIMMSFNGKMC